MRLDLDVLVLNVYLTVLGILFIEGSESWKDDYSDSALMPTEYCQRSQF